MGERADGGRLVRRVAGAGTGAGSGASGKPREGVETPTKVRLQRLMADAGVASRRECEALIESGAVEVNGEVVRRLPVFVDPTRDRIKVRGEPLDRRAVKAERLYLAVFKPDNTLTTTRDDDADPTNSRRTVLDLVDTRDLNAAGDRLIVVGRLGFHATGLVLLTNDGELAQRLSHARYGITKTYRVTVRGKLHAEAMRSLRERFCPVLGGDTRTAAAASPGAQPVDENGTPIEPLRVVRGEGEDSSTVIELVMRAGAGADRATTRAQEARAQRRGSGGNRADSQDGDGDDAVGPASSGGELARMLERMGNPVKKLERIAIGPLKIRFLKSGQCRRLTKEEVEMLRVATGLSKGPLRLPSARPAGEGSRGRSERAILADQQRRAAREKRTYREQQEPRPDRPARSGAATGPRTRASSRADARPEPRADSRPDSRGKPRPGARPGARPGTRPGTGPGARRGRGTL